MNYLSRELLILLLLLLIVVITASINIHSNSLNCRYDVSLDINTRGPGRLMSLAKRCKKLKLFLHISTGKMQSLRTPKYSMKCSVDDWKEMENSIHYSSLFFLRLNGYFAAYVNGQRQGKIFESPFCIGDSIAREGFRSKPSLNFLPNLDVESEINLVEGSRNNASAQTMKEMGLER